jgi:hypothetical protein
VQIGESTVDVAARRVLRGDDEIHLTPTAWHLLEVLLRRPGKLLSQRQLLACRRSRGPATRPPKATCGLFMAQLRRKLEPDPVATQAPAQRARHGLPFRALMATAAGLSTAVAANHPSGDGRIGRARASTRQHRPWHGSE